ncbi:hypothetical protein DT23_10195 [Thioclava indica]|uniref:Uncharacterized protein n=1 Tax=Thioclava indica TaxID=1353528 RepID=A0A074JXP5_9RHOB|nr:hypothetical protein DT23_10195 [Thioclava indica]
MRSMIPRGGIDEETSEVRAVEVTSSLALLNKGGKLCVGNIADAKCTKISRLDASNERVVELIIDAWQKSSIVPDWYELWFDLPEKLS